ncbi:50S ribosomal protein L20 [Jeotgalibaca arthritidis]|uniref:Large ribosomal subunit protein bL20 n=1 Tax=Jeotgalibaca arthritidis TaxID=1868794 RepID=A0A6G7KBC0_9LACT|nr:50S ribosomal protein L20 [Jeotgalibaca arthritidis]QII82522.1 50S ribosomal protein L20 [Jeotgalibaca arthritidis]
MPRVKGGTVTRQRRKKVLKLAKGYYGSKHTLFKTAKQQVMKSHMYAYRDRRQKKRNFRKLWIARINAAARMNGLSYSKLIHGMKVSGNEMNRKMLADLAVNDAAAFTAIAEQASKALENK